MSPNGKSVTLAELLQERLGEDLLREIDGSERYIRRLLLENHAGDQISVTLSRSTAKKVTRAAMILVTSLLGWAAWDVAKGQIGNPPTGGQQTAQTATCETLKR
jgi:hypothetical protein